MASTTNPTEEERILLREHRITNIHTKRLHTNRPHDESASSKETDGEKKNEPQLQKQQHPSPVNGTYTDDSQSQQQRQTQNQKQSLQQNKRKHSPSQKHHHKHHGTGSNHNHHHHHHHHRRQKGLTAVLVQSLEPEELNRTLELASDLSYLNIVSLSKLKGNKDCDEDKKPQDCNSTSKLVSTNNRVKLEQENGTGNKANGHSNNHNNGHHHQNEKNQIAFKQISRYCIDLSAKYNRRNNNCTNDNDDCKPYIFEKVDYIKRFNTWKKESRELKRAKNKAPNVATAASNTTVEAV